MRALWRDLRRDLGREHPTHRCAWCERTSDPRRPVRDGLHESCAREAKATAGWRGARARDDIARAWGIDPSLVSIIAATAWRKVVIVSLGGRLCRVCAGHGAIGCGRRRLCSACKARGYFGRLDPSRAGILAHVVRVLGGDSGEVRPTGNPNFTMRAPRVYHRRHALKKSHPRNRQGGPRKARSAAEVPQGQGRAAAGR